MRALAKKREERFQSAEDLASALRAALAPSRSRGPSGGALLCLVCGGRNAVPRAFCGECGAPLGAGEGRASPRAALPLVARDDDRIREIGPEGAPGSSPTETS
jgi:hypothetical protein